MKALSRSTLRKHLRRKPEESHTMKYVLIGVAVLAVALLIRMTPELRRYMKMRGM